MHKWYVIALAALAVALLVTGMVALILPDAREGPEIYRINRRYALRRLDLAGGTLLVLGCVVAWVAGLVWQRGTYGS